MFALTIISHCCVVMVVDATRTGWSQCNDILNSRASVDGHITNCTSSNTITITITCPSYGAPYLSHYNDLYPYRDFARYNGKDTVCIRFRRQYSQQCGVILGEYFTYWIMGSGTNIRNLNLENNNIVGLEQWTFYYADTIEHLDLEIGNTISTIGYMAFSGLDQLTHLRLRGQNIRRIERSTFVSYYMSNLKVLDLRCSNIEDISVFAFRYRSYGLRNMDIVNLRFNEMNHLHRKSFAL